MRSTDYQNAVRRTMNFDLLHAQALANWALGLAGESGEAVDVLKKHIFHGHTLNRGAMTKELGDVLWYVTAICEQLDIDLGDVMETNVAKLEARYPHGFDAKRSQKRAE